MQPGQQEKKDYRRHPRIACCGLADLRVLPDGPSEPGTLLNLSLRGCCLLAHEPLCGCEESAVEVHFKVRGIDVRVAGVIRHVHRRRRAGIEFVRLSRRKREQLDELVRELMELSAAAERFRAAARKLRDQEHSPEAG